MKRILTALTLSAVLASPAWCEFLVSGNGLLICAEMTQDHDQYAETGTVPVTEQWILGYFTGMNHAKGVKVGQGKSKALYAATLKYCRENPLHDVWWAADDVYNQLK